MDKDNAVWGTVTLAMPKLVEWQIESHHEPISGKELREFFKEMAKVADGREAVVRVNLMLKL